MAIKLQPYGQFSNQSDTSRLYNYTHGYGSWTMRVSEQNGNDLDDDLIHDLHFEEPVSRNSGRIYTTQDQDKIINLMKGLSVMSDRDRRQTVLEQLPRQISSNTAYSSATNIHVLNIVRTCARYPNGIEQLVKVVETFERGTIPFKKLQRFLDKSTRVVVRAAPPKEAIDVGQCYIQFTSEGLSHPVRIGKTDDIRGSSGWVSVVCVGYTLSNADDVRNPVWVDRTAIVPVWQIQGSEFLYTLHNEKRPRRGASLVPCTTSVFNDALAINEESDVSRQNRLACQFAQDVWRRFSPFLARDHAISIQSDRLREELMVDSRSRLFIMKVDGFGENVNPTEHGIPMTCLVTFGKTINDVVVRTTPFTFNGLEKIGMPQIGSEPLSRMKNRANGISVDLRARTSKYSSLSSIKML